MIWLCGAASSMPGEKTMTKLMPRLVQSISRRLAIRAETSLPRTLTVKLSPTSSPNAFAARASKETSGAPV